MFSITLFQIFILLQFCESRKSKRGITVVTYEGTDPGIPQCDSEYSTGYSRFNELDYCFVHFNESEDLSSESSSMLNKDISKVEMTSVYNGEVFHAIYYTLEDCEADRENGIDIRLSETASTIFLSRIRFNVCMTGRLESIELLTFLPGNEQLQLHGPGYKKQNNNPIFYMSYYFTLTESVSSFIRSVTPASEGVVYAGYYRDPDNLCRDDPFSFAIYDMGKMFHVEDLTCLDIQVITGVYWSMLQMCLPQDIYNFARVDCGSLQIWDRYLDEREGTRMGKQDLWRSVFGSILVAIFLAAALLSVLGFVYCTIIARRKKRQEEKDIRI